MILDKIQQTYYAASSSLSNINRQSCLGGIALIWLFKGSIGKSTLTDPSESILLFPNILYWSLVFLVISLIMDFLQYAVTTLIWGAYGYRKEKYLEKNGLDKETHVLKEPPDCINHPALILFWVKIALSSLGFYKLTTFMLTITIGY
ncbi:hypothetical protein [Serratia sp. S4]|uniref:hypothetical protein n=1 Tax=Serratia sp. S4 TaxID=768491 RepID=UPI0008FBC992|nr:hypothetical protein [Serratia sp. S4]